MRADSLSGDMAGTSARARDEAELLGRLRRGDEQAFRDLFRRQHATLLALARTVVANRSSAEEVVQDTWLAVISGIGGFEGRAALSTWIASICLNKARTRAVARRPLAVLLGSRGARRRRCRRTIPTGFCPTAIGRAGSPPGTRSTPSGLSAAASSGRVMAGLIDELPAAQRAVVILRDVEGHAHEEIAPAARNPRRASARPPAPGADAAARTAGTGGVRRERARSGRNSPRRRRRRRLG